MLYSSGTERSEIQRTSFDAVLCILSRHSWHGRGFSDRIIYSVEDLRATARGHTSATDDGNANPVACVCSRLGPSRVQIVKVHCVYCELKKYMNKVKQKP